MIMIGGIFNVLGQAAQQSAEQKQKNTDAQNEMNRMMMMAGYRPNEADPTLTQGGAGLLDSLKSGLKGSFGSTPYEFSPSQYSFDPESPQGRRMAMEEGQASAIAKYYQGKINLIEQDNNFATYTNLIKATEGEINWQKSAGEQLIEIGSDAIKAGLIEVVCKAEVK